MYYKIINNRFSSSLNSSRGRGNKKLGISILERVASHDKSISSLRIKNTANSRGSLRSVGGMSASEYLPCPGSSTSLVIFRMIEHLPGKTERITERTVGNGVAGFVSDAKYRSHWRDKGNQSRAAAGEQWADLWKSRGGFEPVILQ